MDRVRAIWLLAAVVAVVQMGVVRWVGATRWKLGGFGMYSEAHPNQRVLVVRDAAGAPMGPPRRIRCRSCRRRHAGRALAMFSGSERRSGPGACETTAGSALQADGALSGSAAGHRGSGTLIMRPRKAPPKTWIWRCGTS